MEEQTKKTAFPFKGISIKEIEKAGSQYIIHETNHGHSYDIVMNYDILDLSEHDKALMAFIKFVEELISDSNYYHEDIENLSTEQEIEIAEFISMILDRISRMVSTLAEDDVRPTPRDVRACLGQKPNYGDVYLYDIIELLMKANGYMSVPGTFDEIAKIDFTPEDLTESLAKKIHELNAPKNNPKKLSKEDKKGMQ